MKEKLNKYYVLIHYGHFCIEQLQEMSECEMNECYNEILKKL